MHVVQVLPSLQVGLGGPPRSVTGMCYALARCGDRVDVCWVNLGPSWGERLDIDESLTSEHSVRSLHLNAARIYIPLGFRRLLRKVAASADIIHSNGLWMAGNHIAARTAKRLGIPHVICPRGTLTGYGIAHRAWKKKIAMALYQGRDLHEAACFHATSAYEADFIRERGLRQPIAVIPIGLDPSPFARFSPDYARGEIEERWPATRGKNLFFFVSRLHPKKGLPFLIEAWARLCKQWPDWHLVISGPDEDDYEARIKAAAIESGASEHITFSGPVYGDIKLKLYAACEVFILPSFDENFGIVIAEALAASRPVITTVGTPWAELREYQCGWHTRIGAEPTHEAMLEAMSLPDEQRRLMGRRGRELIERRYAWDKIGQDTHAVYLWLLGRGPKPDCVREA